MSTLSIPVNDLRRYAAEVSERLSARAADIVRTGHWVLGPSVAAFESEFAAYCGVGHCIGVANGTDALEIALRALEVKAGDHVVVAANAAMYGTTAVLAIGAVPVFADVDATTALITPATLRAAVASAPTKPVAMIVTHLYGRLADMPALMEEAAALGLRVIEDCAQAHGARGADGRLAGSYGDASTYSFYPTKNLGALGDGGAVASSDNAIAARMRQLRQYGWSSKYTNTLAGGRNSRLDEMQAAFLSQLLPDLDRRNARRRDIANRYSTQIRNAAITVPPVSGDAFVAHLYVVASPARDALRAHLQAAGIGCDVHYPIPDHRQPVHAGRFDGVSLPVTEALCAQVITLPCFPEMTDDEVAAVIAACNDWQAPTA